MKRILKIASRIVLILFLLALAHHLTMSGKERAALFVARGLDLDAKQQYNEAYEYGRMAVRRNPRSAEAHKLLGHEAQLKDRFSESVRELEIAVRLDPKDAESYYYLGSELGRYKQYRAEIRCLKTALLLKPNAIPAHYDLGICYAATGQNTLAMQRYQILRKSDDALAIRLLHRIQHESPVATESVI